jgi:hypothetical protein
MQCLRTGEALDADLRLALSGWCAASNERKVLDTGQVLASARASLELPPDRTQQEVQRHLVDDFLEPYTAAEADGGYEAAVHPELL